MNNPTTVIGICGKINNLVRRINGNEKWLKTISNKLKIYRDTAARNKRYMEEIGELVERLYPLLELANKELLNTNLSYARRKTLEERKELIERTLSWWSELCSEQDLGSKVDK